MNRDDRTAISIGQEAELAVEKMLLSAGLQIMERNYRCKLGEIDIIAREVVKQRITLVFVEVRQRSHGCFGSGLESVDYRKQRKLLRTASCYLLAKKLFDQYPCRFDIVSVRSLTDMQWIKDAFHDS